MSTHPYIPLYVDDYDAHTAHLSLEEDGIYNRLMRLCWRTPGCSLPDEPAWIMRKARITADQYERVAAPIIDEFFSRKNGRIYQARLSEEYAIITAKRAARQNAGKTGGLAKARKTQENVPSNATILPEHARAFPESESKIEEPPNPQGGEGEKVEAQDTEAPTRRRVTNAPAAFEALWLAYPHVKGRSSKADSLTAWRRLPADVQERLPAAARRYASEGREPKADCGAKALERWLRKGLYADWIDGGSGDRIQGAAKRFPDEPTRAAVAGKLGEDFARKWIDPCGWEPERSRIVAPLKYVADQLTREASALKALGISAVRIAQSEGAAA